MNNPMQMLSMLRGGNPQQILQQMMQQDPRVGQAVQMLRTKSPQELWQYGENLAKERGVDFNEFVQNIARQFGMK